MEAELWDIPENKVESSPATCEGPQFQLVASIFWLPPLVCPSPAGMNQRHYTESHRLQQSWSLLRNGSTGAAFWVFHVSHASCQPGREIDWVNSSYSSSSQPEFHLPHTPFYPVPHLPCFLLHPEISGTQKEGFAECKEEFVLLPKSCFIIPAMCQLRKETFPI